MTASSFINALRCFVAICGPVKTLLSDCGSNFSGAQNVLNDALKEMDKKFIDRYLMDNKVEWKCKPPHPPHASHIGGVWE